MNDKGVSRSEKLAEWESAPYARFAHPQEDHLVPIFVAVGAAEDEAAVRVYHEDDFGGLIAVSNFRLGDLPAPGASANGAAAEEGANKDEL